MLYVLSATRKTYSLIDYIDIFNHFINSFNIFIHISVSGNSIHSRIKWINEWTDKWINQWINEWTNKCINKWTNDQMNKWMYVWMNESVNEWIYEWMNERMNTSMNEKIHEVFGLFKTIFLICISHVIIVTPVR